ncbi:hypothetical protein TWF694_010798 [Orbilia ellipsospora]|uniref:Uncharacterized protein n=1 Tax=Orbilia ellipsospora TaxID=2528407 RepID=A0AAV9X9P5_9PEZI
MIGLWYQDLSAFAALILSMALRSSEQVWDITYTIYRKEISATLSSSNTCTSCSGSASCISVDAVSFISYSDSHHCNYHPTADTSSLSYGYHTYTSSSAYFLTCSNAASLSATRSIQKPASMAPALAPHPSHSMAASSPAT